MRSTILAGWNIYIVFALIGCQNPAVDSVDHGSTGSAANTSDTPGEDTTLSPDVGHPTTTNANSGDDDDSTTSRSDATGEDSDGCAFLCRPDDGPISEECNVWDQDCPLGMKCSPWANSIAWDALRCVPVDSDPHVAGEACVVEGSPVSGIDSCSVGVMCWDVDPETNIGTCVPHCIGSPSAPTCADPARSCLIAHDGVLTLCVQRCDPLAQAPCPEGEGCYPVDEAFICAPDGSGEGGGLLMPCEFVNACEAGLLCGNPDQIGELCGPAAPGCCVPQCDLGDPACPPMTECVPFFDDGSVPPDHVGSGICAAVQR